MAQNITLPMHQDWKFKAAAPNIKNQLPEQWLEVDVPCLAHTALSKHNYLPDLFFRDNESKYQYLEREDWIFEKKFDLGPQVAQKQHITLNFKGLDTHCDVFLNGHLVLKANNAFRSWRIDIKPHLRSENNILRLYFYAAVPMDELNRDLNGNHLPGIPSNERMFSRKGQFNYGWDWGPRFVSAGIWRGIDLEAWDNYQVRDFNIHQLSLSDSEAKLQADFLIHSEMEKSINITLDIDNQHISKDFTVKKGLNSLFFDNIKIQNPQRWWSVGLGAQHLYEATLTADNGEKLTQRIGLRTINLVRQKDAKGESFFFRLNGKPVFAKGANYIPLSVFQDQVTAADYRQIIDDALAANMNMLRVWGGGIYENDEFYEHCDQVGIMVWQDFMFACAMYPGDKDFMQSVEAEAIENIKRLRKHPSIALWCGNNEISEAWNNWGWKEQFLLNPARKNTIWNDYKALFEQKLPQLVTAYGNDVDYWASSPSYSRYHEKCDVMGDSHYWGVWHDEEPFEQYAKRVPRFMSEYGFQSFPEWQTIQSFTEPEDRNLETPVMTVHQKHPRGNTLMRKYMTREYHLPTAFEDFTYVSQLVQAEGIRRGIEAHRRAMPYCMGTLYWQLNDVWPVASWSSIDGHGRWKALHYAVREAFAPVALSAFVEKEKFHLFVINDQLSAINNANVTIEVIDFQGNKLFSESKSALDIAAQTSIEIWTTNVKHLLHGHHANEVFMKISLTQNEQLLSQKIHYVAYPKNLKLPTPTITYEISTITNGYQIALYSDKLAKNVFLSTPLTGRWSENYFDLLPNETKIINFVGNINAKPLDLKVKCLTETY